MLLPTGKQVFAQKWLAKEKSDSFYKYFFAYILSVNEKLQVSKCRCFGKYIIQLFGYLTVAKELYYIFLVNDKLVWRDKIVTRAMELLCT